MSTQPIKATSREVTKDPFYLIQTNGSDKRYVVWLCEKVRIRTLIAGFINKAANHVEVKVRDFDEVEDGADNFGEVTKLQLHQLMTKYEEVLFHNGYHDLMIRIPETEECIVFDEHGLIFIYTSDAYDEVLMRLDAVHKPDEKLIYEFDHLHYCMAEGKDLLRRFIDELGLMKEH